MLRWPTRAKAAIRVLFQPLQDIDVYVEDVDDEAFYRTLLQRIAGDIRIARIFGLGGRSAVVRDAQAYTSGTRPALERVHDLLLSLRTLGDAYEEIPQ